MHRALLDAAVPHEVVRLRRPVLSADDLPGALDLAASECVAVRCYVADDRTVAVLMHAGEVPDPVALLDALGARSVRPATASEVNAATDCAAGLVSPVGLPADVALLADSALGAADVVYTAAAEGGVALGIHVRDLLVHTGARVATLSPQPQPRADRSGWSGVIDLDADRADDAALARLVHLPQRRPPA
ncbi:MAG: hypothetical protein JWM64_11 [Frankiales bacterium]|nr:hypothetical protein [Frankiales bacterium]